jgi:hypothetical protein
MEDAKYIGESAGNLIYFNALPPPYFFRAVRSFGEYGAERDEIRPPGHSGSQELFAKKPANTGYFCRWNFGERDLPRGRMADREGFEHSVCSSFVTSNSLDFRCKGSIAVVRDGRSDRQHMSPTRSWGFGWCEIRNWADPQKGSTHDQEYADTSRQEAAILQDFQEGIQDGKGTWQEQGCSTSH